MADALQAFWVALWAGLAAYLIFAIFVQTYAAAWAYRRWRSYGHGRWSSLGVGCAAATGNGWIYCCTCPLGKKARKDHPRK